MHRLLLIVALSLITAAIGAEMKQDVKELEELRLKYESALMDTKGITGIGIGICKDGRSCLKIYTSLPPDQVLPLIPEELKKYDIELEFVGEIKAQ